MPTTNASIVLRCRDCGQSNRVPHARLTSRAICGGCRGVLREPGDTVYCDDATLGALIAGSPAPVLVDFWAPWCGPCRSLAPQFAQVGRELAARVVNVKVNVDEAPASAQAHGVSSIPLVALFVAGREVWRAEGLRPAAQIRAEVERALRAAA